MSTRTILSFPHWQANPYLTMLYLAAEADGWRIAGVTDLDALGEGVEELVPGDVVHVHWTSPVTAGAEDEAAARERLDQFRRTLDAVVARDCRLLWTVHNEIAHDTSYLAVEKAIGDALAERATRIVQLHDRTAEAVAMSYTLPPEKLTTLRHSSYLGIYPDTWTGSEARTALGVPQGAPTVGFVGQMRPYKGLDVLFAAADIAAAELPGLVLLLAGGTSPGDLAVIESSLPRHVDVVRQHSFVADEELGLWLRASDAVVLPYRRVLNSGSAMLAASFGRPVIMPDDTPLAQVYADQPWLSTFRTEGDKAEALAEAIVRTIRSGRWTSATARTFARSYTPYDMSRDYLRLIDGMDTAREAA
jgi:glycosyltransferase involved in cell wall biosynthesis